MKSGGVRISLLELLTLVLSVNQLFLHVRFQGSRGSKQHPVLDGGSAEKLHESQKKSGFRLWDQAEAQHKGTHFGRKDGRCKSF